MQPDERGFSLIELMVVLLVVGILATIAIPNYLGMEVRAKEGGVRAAAHAVQMAAEDYAVTHASAYPPDAATFVPDMFPQGVFPRNPFTGQAITIGDAGTFSQGNVGYTLDAGTRVYTIEGYGENEQSGPNQDGVVITLSNG